MSPARTIALVGNPNSGKTSLFNALTGLRQRVGNFPGVTVDRKVGQVALSGGQKARVVDLPGTYSLYPQSEDERIASRILLDTQHPDHPDLVVLVVDATNLRRGLLLCTQVMDLGLPVVLAINMEDLLEKEGLKIDTGRLSQLLGIPVLTVSALRNKGMKALKKHFAGDLPEPVAPTFSIPASFDSWLQPLMQQLGTENRYTAWLFGLEPESFAKIIEGGPQARPEDPQALQSNELAVRYDRIGEYVDAVVRKDTTPRNSFTGRLDRLLLHPIGGYVIFVGLLFLIFQAIFAWAGWPMDMIELGFGMAGEWLAGVLPEGWFSELLVDGVWAGLGGIVIFVPQIAILFFFISILEDSGYMSRVVFLMDRIMRPFGFSGKSVIPLVGGMACAIPSIMMARTIPNRIERLITIMVTPLMSCSARIPVYVLLISLFVPEDSVAGIFNLRGVVMTGMYFLGFFMALAVAWVIKTIARYKASTATFVTELPRYRTPRWKNTLLEMYHRSRIFVVEAGRIIMVLSIILWFLASYGPGDKMEEVGQTYDAKIAQVKSQVGLGEEEKADQVAELRVEKNSEVLKTSYAGILGRTIEPVIKPLGFDWKIGIALISSFAAREVFVGTMATIYSAGDDAADEEDTAYVTIRERMSQERDTEGNPVYTAAVAISLLIFYAFAMQCMSTLAIVQKETRSWRLTIIMLVYMTGLAYVASFVTYQLLA